MYYMLIWTDGTGNGVVHSMRGPYTKLASHALLLLMHSCQQIVAFCPVEAVPTLGLSELGSRADDEVNARYGECGCGEQVLDDDVSAD